MYAALWKKCKDLLDTVRHFSRHMNFFQCLQKVHGSGKPLPMQRFLIFVDCFRCFLHANLILIIPCATIALAWTFVCISITRPSLACRVTTAIGSIRTVGHTITVAVNPISTGGFWRLVGDTDSGILARPILGTTKPFTGRIVIARPSICIGWTTWWNWTSIVNLDNSEMIHDC